MTIRVISLDFDGCIFNQEYHRLMKDKSHIDFSIQYNSCPFKDALLLANKRYFDNLAESIREDENIVLMIGSNRQSYPMDNRNSLRNKTGSCFTAIEIITEYLVNQSSSSVNIDFFLLADLYGGLEEGTSFARAKPACEIIDQINLASIQGTLDQSKDYAELITTQGYQNCVSDESKLAVLYAQMQKIANQYPGEQIIYEFYDDREDILDNLNEFFTQNLNLIPKNVRLVLNKYNGRENASVINTLQGIGEIDDEYQTTVIAMTELALNKSHSEFFSNIEEGKVCPECNIIESLGIAENKI